MNQSGMYTIELNGRHHQAYCDMDTPPGGWTVIQRRQDGSVSFNRTWGAYKKGFGSPTAEFWWGLEKLHQLTSTIDYRLRIDFVFAPDGRRTEPFAAHINNYAAFRIGNESTCYQASVEREYPEWQYDIFSNDVQPRFEATSDDVSGVANPNCVHPSAVYSSGWWGHGIRAGNLNGPYKPIFVIKSAYCVGCIGWWLYPGTTSTLQFTEMRIRPRIPLNASDADDIVCDTMPKNLPGSDGRSSAAILSSVTPVNHIILVVCYWMLVHIP